MPRTGGSSPQKWGLRGGRSPLTTGLSALLSLALTNLRQFAAKSRARVCIDAHSRRAARSTRYSVRKLAGAPAARGAICARRARPFGFDHGNTAVLRSRAVAPICADPALRLACHHPAGRNDRLFVQHLERRNHG